MKVLAFGAYALVAIIYVWGGMGLWQELKMWLK